MKITKDTKIKEMKASLERVKEWFESFGYNVYGIAVSGDVEDPEEILREVNFALDIEKKEEKE